MDEKTIQRNDTARLKNYICAVQKVHIEEHWNHRFEGMTYSEPVTTKLGNCAVVFDFGSNPVYLSYAWECLLDAMKSSQDLRGTKLDVYGWTDSVKLLYQKQNERMLRTNTIFSSLVNQQMSFNTLVMSSKELKKPKYELIFVVTEFGIDSKYNIEDARAYYQLSDTMMWVLPLSSKSELYSVKNSLRIKKYILLEK